MICYRPKSAVRDVGKALGLDAPQLDRLAGAMQWWDGNELADSRIRDAGLDPANPLLARVLALTRELIGFPRHLSQHAGGFVISRGPLEELVPIENAAMPERTVIQWDKDDLDELGLLKVDVLGLGMLSAIRRALALVAHAPRRRVPPGRHPGRGSGRLRDDLPGRHGRRVPDRIARADGDAAATAAALLLRPRDRGRDRAARPDPGPDGASLPASAERRGAGRSIRARKCASVLERTLGVPIFQEQVMQLAIVAAGFTPGEADRLRRAMAAWKRKGSLGPFEQRLIEGMRARGYDEGFARQVFQQIQGFGEYGFPESHAASFALLVYVSAWLKCHEPAAFCCALLNSQPMGFYAPAQLVRDARAHGVSVRAVDVNASAVESTLEPPVAGGRPALRLGLGRVRGLSRDGAEAWSRHARPAPTAGCGNSRAARGSRGATSRRWRRPGRSPASPVTGIVRPGRCSGIEPPLPLRPMPQCAEGLPLLRAPIEGEDIVADYRALGLTLARHPLALLRPAAGRLRLASPAAEVRQLPDGAAVTTGGIVLTRQRPGSASGVIFVTLEDETGYVNLVVWSRIADRASQGLARGAAARRQRAGCSARARCGMSSSERLEDRSALLGAWRRRRAISAEGGCSRNRDRPRYQRRRDAERRPLFALRAGVAGVRARRHR